MRSWRNTKHKKGFGGQINSCVAHASETRLSETRTLGKLASQEFGCNAAGCHHDNKREVHVYDYADVIVPRLARRNKKRLAGYSALGYTVVDGVRGVDAANRNVSPLLKRGKRIAASCEDIGIRYSARREYTGLKSSKPRRCRCAQRTASSGVEVLRSEGPVKSVSLIAQLRGWEYDWSWESVHDPQ